MLHIFFPHFFFFFKIKKKINICFKTKKQKKNIYYEIYFNGYFLFLNFFKTIFTAKKNIFFQFYILKNDFLGKKFLKLLYYKSYNCYVFLIIDKLGSLKLKFIKKILFFFFNNKKLLINIRNHKKIIFIDDNLLWVGGNNIGLEYLNFNILLNKWNDFHCKILNITFNYLFKNILNKNNFLIKKNLISKKNFFLENNVFEIIKYIIKYIIKKKIIIISPYLIIDLQIIKILTKIIKIKILIYLSYKTDNIFIQNTSIIFVKILKKKNIKILFLYPGFYHKKIYIFDKKYILIGSLNFDIRSNYFNKECLLIINNKKFISIFFKKIKKNIFFKKNYYKKKNIYIKFFYIISFITYFLQ